MNSGALFLCPVIHVGFGEYPVARGIGGDLQGVLLDFEFEPFCPLRDVAFALHYLSKFDHSFVEIVRVWVDQIVRVAADSDRF